MQFVMFVFFNLQVLESLNLVLVVGLAVDYVVHLAEGYCRSHHSDRLGRTKDMLMEVGVSVLSGAVTTMGAAALLMFAQIIFFFQFGLFIFCTILFSICYALLLFSTFMALAGPQGTTGSIKPLLNKISGLCKRKSDVNITHHQISFPVRYYIILTHCIRGIGVTNSIQSSIPD